MVVFAPSLEHLGTAGVPVDGASSAGDLAPGAIGPPQLVAVSGGHGAAGGTTIDRDPDGQFHLIADIGGHPVRFLIDTGSDGVALSEADAASVGITIDSSAFTPVARTASGTGMGAHVQLAHIEVAGQDLSDVDALVLRGLGVSLLGQSVLRRIGSVTVVGDRMTIGT